MTDNIGVRRYVACMWDASHPLLERDFWLKSTCHAELQIVSLENAQSLLMYDVYTAKPLTNFHLIFTGS